MNILKLAAFFAIAILVPATAAHAASICPTTVNTNSDCGYILTIGPGGVVTGAPVTGAAPYDGGDDSLIGVVNNSGSIYNGSIQLTGSGNGGGLFAFDGDGICNFTHAAYCTTAPTGYEGPNDSFSNLMTTSVFHDTGTVNFAGLASGGSTFFSLESSPSSFGNPVINGAAPEPSSLILLGTGALGLAGSFRRRILNAVR